jgi:molecular chaperone GrpE
MLNNHPKETKEAKEVKEVKEEQSVTLKDSEYLQLKADAEKAGENWDKLLRLQADFDNFRKRTDKERQEFVKYASEDVLVGLLEILDDLERTLALGNPEQKDLSMFLKGVEMILAHLYDLLKHHGVKPIEAEGKKFDPCYHEALIQVENKDLPEHTIVEELQKGYLLNDKVIRTAKVKVSRKPA